MINELFQLSESLRVAGVSLPSWHRYYRVLPMSGDAVCIELDHAGQVAGMSFIDPEKRRYLRKYEYAQGHSFPSFNIKPLRKFKDKQDRKRFLDCMKSVKGKGSSGVRIDAEELEYLFSASEGGWTVGDKGKLESCLHKTAQSLKEELGSCDGDLVFCSFLELLRRAQNINVSDFYDQLSKFILDMIKSDSGLDGGRWLDVLFGESKWVVVLELADWSKFDYPANHSVILSEVNSRLLRNGPVAVAETEKETDVFGVQMQDRRIPKRFFQVLVPVLSNVNFRPMSDEVPCQDRYGLQDTDSFTLSEQSQQRLKDALEWITDGDRRGKTWNGVSLGRDKKGLLIVYPSKMPGKTGELSNMSELLCGNEFIEASFVKCAERVSAALKGLPESYRNSELCVFVLTQPDWRTKLYYSRRYSVQHLLDSAEDWQKCCSNIPLIRIRQFEQKGDGKSERVWKEPIVPYPGNVAWCLNTKWRAKPKGNAIETVPEAVSDFEFSEALSLLLAEGLELKEVSTKAIRLFLRNVSPLMIAVSHADHQGRIHTLNKYYRKQSLLLPKILALLLGKFGDRKGDYMKNAPYVVGQLFSLADQLQVKYSHHVRMGMIPSKLRGGVFLDRVRMTKTSPLTQVLLFRDRIAPYLIWAKTVQGGDDVGIIRYLSTQIDRCFSTIYEAGGLSDRFSEAETLEMLAGYGAANPKTNTNISSSEGD